MNHGDTQSKGIAIAKLGGSARDHRAPMVAGLQWARVEIKLEISELNEYLKLGSTQLEFEY
jgi:hypothetical protein